MKGIHTRPIGRIVAVTAAGSMASGLATCSISTDSVTNDTAATGKSGTSETVTESTKVPRGDGSRTIYLVSKDFQHRSQQAVKEGTEQAGTEFNYRIQFVGPDDETKTTQQLDQLQAALDTRSTATGPAALDSGAADLLLTRTESVGIPLVAFDSGIDSDPPFTMVSTGSYAATEETAKHMTRLLDEQRGTIDLVCHDAASATGKQRCEGSKNYFEKNVPPGLKFLDEQIAGEVGRAADILKATVQANPDTVGTCGSNETVTFGAVQGTTKSGKELVVIGFNSGKVQINAIRNDSQAGAATQAPKLMGYKTVTVAIQAINRITLPKTIDSGFYWYDKSNIDSNGTKPSLYE